MQLYFDFSGYSDMAVGLMYLAMLDINHFGISDTLDWQIRPDSIIALIMAIALVFLVPVYEEKTQKRLRETPSFALQCFVMALFGLALIKLTAENFTPFLYFQF